MDFICALLRHNLLIPFSSLIFILLFSKDNDTDELPLIDSLRILPEYLAFTFEKGLKVIYPVSIFDPTYVVMAVRIC